MKENGLKLCQGSFRLDIGVNTSMEGVVQHSRSCPRQGSSPHAWRGLKAVCMWHLGTGVSGSLDSAGQWLDSMVFVGFSNLKDPVIP